MENPKFQILLSNDHLYFFRLTANDGATLLRSEGYPSQASCQIGIGSVKLNATVGERYQRKTASDGQFYFVLVAPKGEVLALSEMYATELECDDSMEAVRKTARDAPLEDFTRSGRFGP